MNDNLNLGEKNQTVIATMGYKVRGKGYKVRGKGN